MKYIKKILIILFLVIMISGCKVTYELKINNDLSINEKAIISENTNRLTSRTNLDVNQSVQYLYKIYKPDFMSDGSYSISSKYNDTYVTVNNTYSSIEDYSKKFSNDLFSLYNSYDNKKHITIDIAQMDLLDSKATNRYVYDEIDVSIEVPFEVIDTNAEIVNGNIYKWHIKPDTNEYKSLYIEFNGERPKNTVSFSLGKKSFFVGYEWIILVAVVIAIVVALSIVYIKNKKNNRV
jgi:hypothetical protein